MNNKKYIPKNTHDIDAVRHLKNLPFQSIKDDVPLLLEWLQDTHWDVAEGIAEYLSSHVSKITKELLDILNSNDGMWKYFLIYGLIARSKERLDTELITALTRIAEHPSETEKEDGVDEAAKNIISNRQLCS